MTACFYKLSYDSGKQDCGTPRELQSRHNSNSRIKPINLMQIQTHVAF